MVSLSSNILRGLWIIEGGNEEKKTTEKLISRMDKTKAMLGKKKNKSLIEKYQHNRS